MNLYAKKMKKSVQDGVKDKCGYQANGLMVELNYFPKKILNDLLLVFSVH